MHTNDRKHTGLGLTIRTSLSMKPPPEGEFGLCFPASTPPNQSLHLETTATRLPRVRLLILYTLMVLVAKKLMPSVELLCLT